LTVAETIADFIGGAMSPPLIVLLSIIAATLVLEDAATVAVGMLAAHGSVPVALALTGLVLGTILGDMALHLAGRWAARSRRFQRLRSSSGVVRAEQWLERRQFGALAIARFVPGLRLPTFVASGVLRFPLLRTFAVLTVVTLIWTPALFWLSHGVMAAAESIGLLGWIVAAALGVATLLAPRLARRQFARAQVT